MTDTMREPSISVPSPDPTDATVLLVRHAISAHADIIDARLAAVYAEISAINKATVVFTDNLTRVPTQLTVATDRLQELVEAKLAALTSHVDGLGGRYEQHFKFAAESRIENALAAKEQIQAAVNYLKESVLKSEAQADLRFVTIGAQIEKLANEQGDFVPRPESNANLSAINATVAALSKQVDNFTGEKTARSASQSSLVALGVLGVGLIGAMIAGVTLFNPHAAAVAPAIIYAAPPAK